MTRNSDSKQSTAHFLLEALSDAGVEYLFSNFGTDHAPIIEEMAQWKIEGRPSPAVIICPHENTAMHMAAGYAIATGRGQGVFVHVDAGTANAALGAHNLARTRVPVLLMAGKAPFTSFGELAGSRDEYVHFVQEPFDQGSLVRPYVKWEYNLPSGVIVKEVLRRAHSMMHSDPRGPVYLTLARETLAEKWDSAAIREFPDAQHPPVRSEGVDPHVIKALAERLIAAREPMLITSYAGRNPIASAMIERLSRLAGIKVFEFNPISNVGREFPGFCGFQPGQHAGSADFGLLVDTDVPWIPQFVELNPSTFWAQIDVDAVKHTIPLWSFPTNMRIQGASGRVLEQLLEAVEAMATADFRNAAAKRWQRLEEEFRQRKTTIAQLAERPGEVGAINPHYVLAEVAKRLEPDDIVVNEAVTNAPKVVMQIPRPLPNTMIRHGGTGLGSSGGLALGAKLAAQKQLVVRVVGDGGFFFGNPLAVEAVAKQYSLPIFTIILDNSGWSAVKELTLRMYPDGAAKTTDDHQALLAPGMDLSKTAEVTGAYGERVSDPALVPAAIDRCIAAIHQKRSAIMQVIVPPL